MLVPYASWVEATDIDGLDVRHPSEVDRLVQAAAPDIIFHLAGAKHAPEGELDPSGALATNAFGTGNILGAADGARVVTASTCKAINPETAYGASKLIAERLTLNYENGAVARFHNVVETQGNVFDLWESEPHELYPVTDCWRYFLTKDEALSLLLYAAAAPRGLYCWDSGPPQSMRQIAGRLYGDRLREVPRRRGDRHREPFVQDDESVSLFDGPIRKLSGPHAGA